MTEATMNLTVARSPKSVWDKPGFASTLSTYDRERWLAAAAGTTLAVVGTRRGGTGGGLIAALGSLLAVRAAMGRRDLRVARNWIDRTLKERGYRARDIVQHTSEESFPASDSPSWTPTSGVRGGNE